MISIIGCFFSFSAIVTSRIKDAAIYSLSVNQVLSDIKMTQQLAITSHETCRIEFISGGNTYRMIRGSSDYMSGIAGRKIIFGGKNYFIFVHSGETEVGGSGTLAIGGAPKAKRIVVSSRGRIRVE